MAYLAMNPYYLMHPEIELNHGYGDIFLMPDTSFGNKCRRCFEKRMFSFLKMQ
ncbi:MAG: hypothetical protein II937_17170 [Bacteroidales bacterium]|nr:hypothetical protein [Bacteroidales bacterium]